MTDLVADVVELAREPGANERRAAGRPARRAGGRRGRSARRRRPRAALRREALPRAGQRRPGQRIGRAISNLLDNAAKWSPDGGEVEVEASGRPGLGPRPRPGLRPTPTSPRSSTASGAPTRRAASRAPGSAWRSCSGSPRSTAARASAANAEGGGALVAIELPLGPTEAQATLSRVSATSQDSDGLMGSTRRDRERARGTRCMKADGNDAAQGGARWASPCSPRP